MHPILLKVGPVTIFSLGVFLVLSVILASFLIWKKARKIGLSEEKVFDTFILTIFLSLIGGRIGYVITHWPVFSVDLSRVILFGHYSGISFQAAFLTGLLALFVIAKFLELDGLLLADIFSLAFSWAVILGGTGCFLDGCLNDVFSSVVVTLLFAGLAVTISLFSWKVDRSVNLASITRRPGFFISAYLIFFTLSLLIVPKAGKLDEKVIYLVLLFVSVIFFLWRYKQFFRMVKFPPNVLSQIKDYLENKSKEAEENLKDLKKEDPFEDNQRLLDRASDDSEAQSKFGHERTEALRLQLQTVLVQTRKALTKIKIGKYGVCESCGKMIDTDRLAAMPTATKCLSCEKKREK